MKLKIKKTFKGAEDGCTVREYRAGETYEIKGDLAKVALANDWAHKARGAAPDNKAKTASPDNKGN